MKKITLLLTMILLFGLFCPAVLSAEEENEIPPSFIVSLEDAVQGEKVTVKVGIRDNPGLITLVADIFFDQDVLELVSVKNSGLLNGWIEPDPEKKSPCTLAWGDYLTTENNTSNGVIAELVFKVKKDAPVGPTVIRVESSDSYAAAGMDMYRVYFTEGSSSLNITGKNKIALSGAAIAVICSVIAAVVLVAVIVAAVLIVKKRKKNGANEKKGE